MSVSSDEQEYKNQLSEVEALLQENPSDPSLLQLRDDLLELITLTDASTEEASQQVNPLHKALEEAVEGSLGVKDDRHLSGQKPSKQTDAGDSRNKKRKTASTEFELPSHLVPLDTDTEAEKNKKRRAAKVQKRKWRSQQKDRESEKKQKSWQSFQKKKKLKDSSMFATRESEGRVGVVSMRQMTKTDPRRKHVF